MRGEDRDTIERITGARVTSASGLAGGCVGDVFKMNMSDGGTLVAKLGAPGSGLETEGWMLETLKTRSALPVPRVIHADDALLILSFIDGDGSLNQAAQRHGAALVAGLHRNTAPKFGLERATLIGGLHQPNPWTDTWVAFFRDQRLLFMGRDALDAGRLPADLMRRIETFAGKIDRFIEEPARPALIHGDMWTGNVIAGRGQIAGFIDPAIYYAHPEIELAFTTLFGTFGRAFFNRYNEISPIAPGFFEERRDIYNLYPLLVHVRLFGGSYVSSVDATLQKLGF